MTLPTCTVQYPSCGACGGDTDYDGDSFYCEGCQLDYGDGEDGTVATFLDEGTPACGKPCTNEWHRTVTPRDCRPCQLPNTHTGHHWTGCTPKETR